MKLIKQLQLLILSLLFIPSLDGQGFCNEFVPDLASDFRFHLVIQENPLSFKYVDGKTCVQKLGVRTTTVGYGGTAFELVEYAGLPNVFAIKSLGGCSTRWMDGATCSGGVTFRNQNYASNPSWTGTRWRFHHLGDGKYALEALGPCSKRWLCYKDNTFVLRETYDKYGDFFRIDPFIKTTVFQSGTEGYHTFRIASMIATQNGNLIAFAEGRKSQNTDWGNIDIVMKRSFNNGLTWSKLKIIWSDKDNTCGNTTALVDGSRIWLFMTHNKGTDKQKDISSLESDGGRSMWVRYSDNEGQTWSKPKNISQYVQLPGTRWDGTGPGLGIKKRDGTLMMPGLDRVIASFDGGRTWARCMPKTKIGGSEANLVELDDESIMRIRRHGGGYAKVSISSDDGYTWSKEYSDKELPTPVCMVNAFRFSFATEGPSRLLFSSPSPATRTPNWRQEMTVRISYDNGKNWSFSKLIWPKFSAYSCLTRLCNNTVGILYEEGDIVDTEKRDYDRIVFQNFSLNWLTDWEDLSKRNSTPTAVEDLETPEYWSSIFPNPADRKITISNAKFISHVVIFDSRGKSIRTISLNPTMRDAVEIDFSGIPSGIYFIEIRNKDGRRVMRKVVKR